MRVTEPLHLAPRHGTEPLDHEEEDEGHSDGNHRCNDEHLIIFHLRLPDCQNDIQKNLGFMSGRRLTCTHKIDSAAHTGFWLTCAQKSVSVVHTEPSGDGVGPVNVIIFLAVQQTQKLLILVQLPVGWGGVITFMFLCTHRHSNLIIFLAVQQTLHHHHHQHHHHQQQQHLRAQLCFFFACTTESVFAYTTEAHHPLCLCHPSKKCVLKKREWWFSGQPG